MKWQMFNTNIIEICQGVDKVNAGPKFLFF